MNFRTNSPEFNDSNKSGNIEEGALRAAVGEQKILQ